MPVQYVENLGSLTYDNLVSSSDFPLKVDTVTIKSAADVDLTLKKGSVLGIITASGLASLCDSTAEDGSQVPHCVLAEDIFVPKTEDTIVHVYMTGVFNPDSLIFGGTDKADMHKHALNRVNIYLKQMV